MARPVPLFVELCAGTAALSLRLHRAGARPPVSRLGSKQGYADAILQVLGLQPGQGAGRFLWCEPDDGTRLLLHAYRDHLLAEQAATHLRGWHGEPALELWEGLRDEGPFQCPAAPDPREAARYVWIEGRQLQNGGFAREQAATHKRQADRVTAKAHAAEVGREIARARERLGMTRAQVSSAVLGRPTGACWNWEHGAPVSEDVWPAVRDLLGLGHLDEKVIGGTVITLRPIPNAKTWTVKLRSCNDFADRLDRLPVLPAEIHTDARRLDPRALGQLAEGAICYMDPPYVGTTQYSHHLPRAEVVELALAWADAGAWVVISEAEPLPELLAQGWHQQEITWCRRGAARTFSKQQREFLTMNRPGYRPPAPRRPLLSRPRGKVLG